MKIEEKNKRIKADAERRLREYEHEVRRRKMINYSVYGVTAIASIIFFSLLFTSHGNEVLAVVGFRGGIAEKSGVYADCSKPENRNVRYCQKGPSSSERSWQTIKRGGSGASPFSLHGN